MGFSLQDINIVNVSSLDKEFKNGRDVLIVSHNLSLSVLYKSHSKRKCDSFSMACAVQYFIM